jgi:acyl-CoA dehydrogenase
MSDALVAAMAEDVLSAACSPRNLAAAERDGWSAEIWSAVSQAGLHLIGVGEEHGGVGGSLEDAMVVLAIAGRHGAPVPMAENGALAGWLLAGAGLTASAGVTTIAPGRSEDSLFLSDGRLRGQVHRVPWAGRADEVVVLVADCGRWSVARAAAGDLKIEAGVNLAGEPRDTVSFDDVRPVDVGPAAVGIDPLGLRIRGALTRTVLMAGALEAVSGLTQRYTRERRQFGKPIGSFQAVQAHVVRCAQAASLVSIASRAAARALGQADGWFEVGAAKIVADEAATTATTAAHQAHGAMGMTYEYPLQQLTRRLWSWRAEHGTARYWSETVGRRLQGLGADALYPTLTAGSCLDRSQLIN